MESEGSKAGWILQGVEEVWEGFVALFSYHYYKNNSNSECMTIPKICGKSVS